MGQAKLVSARHGWPCSSYRMFLYGYWYRCGTASREYYYGAISYPYCIHSSYYYYVLLVLISYLITYRYGTAASTKAITYWY